MLDIYKMDGRLYSPETVFDRIGTIDEAMAKEDAKPDNERDREKMVRLAYEKMLQGLWLQYTNRHY